MKSFPKPMLAILVTGAWMGAATAGAFSIAAERVPQDKAQNKTDEKAANHEVCGTIRAIKGLRLTVETRTGSLVQVDATPATQGHRAVTLAVDHAVDAIGTLDKAGVLHAETIQHAKPSPAMWPADR